MDYKKLINYRDQNNHFAKFIGIKTREVKKGYACGEIDVQNNHTNIINSIHGGCLYSLADTIGGTAAASHGSYMATISGNLNYLSAGLNVKKIIAIAREVKHGKRISVYNISIEDETGKLLAQGVFSYFNLNKEINLE